MTSDSEECVEMKRHKILFKDFAVVTIDWKMTKKSAQKGVNATYHNYLTF